MPKQVWFIVDETLNPIEYTLDSFYPYSPMFFDEYDAVACLPSNGNFKIVSKWINFYKE